MHKPPEGACRATDGFVRSSPPPPKYWPTKKQEPPIFTSHGYDVLLYPPTPATQPRSNKPTGRGDLSPIQWGFLGGKYINTKTNSTEGRVMDIYIYIERICCAAVYWSNARTSVTTPI